MRVRISVSSSSDCTPECVHTYTSIDLRNEKNVGERRRFGGGGGRFAVGLSVCVGHWYLIDGLFVERPRYRYTSCIS